MMKLFRFPEKQTLSQMRAGLENAARVGKDLSIGIVTGAAVFSGMLGWEYSDQSALKQALEIEQDFVHYRNHANDLSVKKVSMLDASFTHATKGLVPSNSLFIRDAVIHRHELACDRDSLYRKEASELNHSYLGCSIDPVVYSDGVHVHTYSIGERFAASVQDNVFNTANGEHKEYRTDLVFPHDFQETIRQMAGELNALNLSRLAVDLQLLTRGQGQAYFVDKPESNFMLIHTIARSEYDARWLANGGDLKQMLGSLHTLGLIPSEREMDYDKVLAGLSDPTRTHEIIDQIKVEFQAMASIVSELEQAPSVLAVRANLDHNCQYPSGQSLQKGFDEVSTRCAQEAGVQMSPQLHDAIANAQEIGNTSIHGRTTNRVVLGAYKGHPVLVQFQDKENPAAAWVRWPSNNQEHWATSFLQDSYKPSGFRLASDPPPTDKGITATAAIHFNHVYIAHHSPIYVNSEALEKFNVDQLSKQHQQIFMEYILEHERKHILDYKLWDAKQIGSKEREFAQQQTGCDLYAVDQITRKYQDPYVLRTLKESVDKVIKDKGEMSGFVKTVFMSGAERIKQASTVHDALLEARQIKASVDWAHSQNSVSLYIDKKIEELESRTFAPKNNSARDPANSAPSL